MWIVGAATGSLVHGPSRDLEHTIGAGMGSIQHGRIWTPLTSVLWAGNLLGYLGATVLLIAVAAPLERRMGTIKLAIAGASTQILGVLLGLGWASFAKVFDSSWGFRLHVGSAVGASAWIVGAAMAASSNMGTLWRRRIRVGTFGVDDHFGLVQWSAARRHPILCRCGGFGDRSVDRRTIGAR